MKIGLVKIGKKKLKLYPAQKHIYVNIKKICRHIVLIYINLQYKDFKYSKLAYPYPTPICFIYYKSIL